MHEIEGAKISKNQFFPFKNCLNFFFVIFEIQRFEFLMLDHILLGSTANLSLFSWHIYCTNNVIALEYEKFVKLLKQSHYWSMTIPLFYLSSSWDSSLISLFKARQPEFKTNFSQTTLYHRVRNKIIFILIKGLLSKQMSANY